MSVSNLSKAHTIQGDTGALVISALAAVFWGTNFEATRIALLDLPPWSAAAGRVVLAVIASLLWLALTKGISWSVLRRNLVAFAVLGIIGVGGFTATLFLGMKTSSPVTAALIMGTSPLTTNLLEGQFPPYEEVIPKETDKKMIAGTADLLSAVRRAALLTAEDSKGVRMEFTKKGLTLTSRNPEQGEAKVDFACKFDGGDITIGFNPAFLGDALKVVDADEVSFELTAPNRPGLLKAGTNFLYVIMPVNLQ